jgi:hypothetical protein
MSNLLAWIAARLKERSTWMGLIGLLSTVGISISPEYSETIVTVGVALGSGIAILSGDQSPMA